MLLRLTLAAGLAASIGLAVPAPAKAATAWPGRGQAAYALGGAHIAASPGQRAVPIASVAKVMTAYLLLGSYPLTRTRTGPVITVSAQDVADTARRRANGESTVPVRRGERLTERQALAAMLLPSANNVAVMVARKVAGTIGRFVWRMNAAARRLGMSRTRYTDPSGLDAGTVSTARDQTVLLQAATADPYFVAFAGLPRYRLPVAGIVHNYDTLLGHDGFAGIKTGSDDPAGGCFAFRSWRIVDRRTQPIVGVVLGQRGGDLVAAGLNAARALVDRVALHAAAVQSGGSGTYPRATMSRIRPAITAAVPQDRLRRAA